MINQGIQFDFLFILTFCKGVTRQHIMDLQANANSKNFISTSGNSANAYKTKNKE